MSSTIVANKTADRDSVPAIGLKALAGQPAQRIPGAFQLLVAIYIILTGDFPTIVQAFAFGVPGGGGAEFAAAIFTSLARDVLLLLPLFLLAKHPMGILHPLILAVVVWPIMAGMLQVLQQFGGWAGVLAGLPVEAPYFVGLQTRDASRVWTAIAKYNGIEILSLASIYVGFWFLSRDRKLAPHPRILANTNTFRSVLIGLFALSMTVLFVFVYMRGGLAQHLTALGGGRFRELGGFGPILVFTELGAIVLYLWIAARPGDIKSPLFLGCLLAITASQFVSVGSRGSALTVPMLVALVWSLRRHRVPWKLALALMPVMFISFGFMGAIRTSSWTGSNAGEAFTATTWADSLTFAQWELAERRANSADVPITERGFQVTDGPLLGSSYLPVVTTFIPRAVWEDKPRGTGSLYAQLFLGASKDGLGIPVGPEAEMYWNFGLPGVVLISMIYGILLRWIYNFYHARYPDPFAIVFYVLFVTRFDFGTKRLIEFEQMAVLLLLALVVVRMFVPQVLRAVDPADRWLADRRRRSAPAAVSAAGAQMTVFTRP